MKTRYFLLAAVFVPAALTAALGPRYGGELTVGLPELPASATPGLPGSSGARLLAGLAHETLVGLTPDGLPTPALASFWAVSAGGREINLSLREARFHDDRPVRAEDAARSLRRFLRGPGTAATRMARDLDGGSAYRSGASEELPGLSAADDRRLVLRLVADRLLPLAPLASPAAAISGPGGAGCGPFVPTVTLPGRRLALTAFPGHVRGRPYLDRVQLEVAAARTSDVSPGAGGVSALASTLLLILDSGRPPFRDDAIRARTAGAFDRLALASLMPGAEAASSLLAPPLLPPLGLVKLSDGGPLHGPLSLAVATDVPPLVSQRVVAHFAALGSTVRVLPAPPSSVLAVPAEARLLLWSPEVGEAGLALEELAALGPEDPASRAALQAAAEEVEVDRHRGQLLRAEEALRSRSVLVPLCAVPVAFAARPAVHGLRVDLTGRLVLEDAWLEP